MDGNNIAQIVIAIATITVNIIIFVLTYNQVLQMKRIDVNDRYYSILYDDLLLTTIPRAQDYIQIINGKLIGFEELLGALNDLMKKSIYFKFADKDFYEKVKAKKCQIEDYVMGSANRNIPDDDKSSVSSRINRMISELYTIIVDSQSTPK